MLDIRHVAELLSISRDGVYRLIREGELRPARVGERWRFLPEDVRSYLERRASRGARRELVTDAEFDVDKYRVERLCRLERENEHVCAERTRLELLLGLAVRAAVAGTGLGEKAFLGALCELAGTDPARAAHVEQRERRRREAQMDRVVQVLQVTA